jgi:hypothetical protein
MLRAGWIIGSARQSLDGCWIAAECHSGVLCFEEINRPTPQSISNKHEQLLFNYVLEDNRAK